MPNFHVIYWDPAKPANGGYEVVVGPNPDTSFTAADGPDANGLAAIQTGKQGKYVSWDVTDAVATLTETETVAVNNPTTF